MKTKYTVETFEGKILEVKATSFMEARKKIQAMGYVEKNLLKEEVLHKA